MSCSLYQDSEKPPAAFSRRSEGTVRPRIRFIPLLAVASLDGLSRHPTRVFYVVSPLKTITATEVRRSLPQPTTLSNTIHNECDTSGEESPTEEGGAKIDEHIRSSGGLGPFP